MARRVQYQPTFTDEPVWRPKAILSRSGIVKVHSKKKIQPKPRTDAIETKSNHFSTYQDQGMALNNFSAHVLRAYSDPTPSSSNHNGTPSHNGHSIHSPPIIASRKDPIPQKQIPVEPAVEEQKQKESDKDIEEQTQQRKEEMEEDQTTNRSEDGKEESKTNEETKENEKIEVTEVIEQWILDNLQQQQDEFESISDIYSTEITAIKEPSSYCFKMVNDDDESQHILLDIKCPKEYPSSLPPKYSISSSYLKHIPNRGALEERLSTIWSENKGQCMMFEWISEFQEFAATIFSGELDHDQHDDSNQFENESLIQQLMIHDLNTSANNDDEKYGNNGNYGMQSMHGQHGMKLNASNGRSVSDPRSYSGNNTNTISIEDQRNRLRQTPDILCCRKVIEDRKSVFKSWAAFVSDGDQIGAFLDELKSNKKIARATHNIVAYRLSSSTSGIVNEHFDDDGEFGGGKVILEILRKRSICDVVVVVTRWYGGIHLSSDRFKHIKTLTAAIIDQEKIRPNMKYADHLKGGSNGKKGSSESTSRKPMKKSIDRGQQIANRLYWSDSDHSIARGDVFIGCKTKDRKLNLVEINLDEYGVQKSGIDWIEWISYRGTLVWDIRHLCRTFEEIQSVIGQL